MDDRSIMVALSNELRLLIMACSQHKSEHPQLIPAIDRYDGLTYRVLRRYLQNKPQQHLHVYILSAEFGLISSHQPLPRYDRRMTSERVCELRPSVVAAMSRLLNEIDYHDLFICAGKTYLQVLEGYNKNAPPTVCASIATGPPGRRLSQLHDWLNGSPPMPYTVRQSVAKDGRVIIRGVEIQETSAHMLDVARQALDEGVDGVDSYQSWYVPVENRRVAPKWLVSRLSGLPVSAFTTGEARRVLTQLGIDVERVPQQRGTFCLAERSNTVVVT